MAKNGNHERSLVTVDPLHRYLQEVQKFPILSEEEEKDLFRRYRDDGDIEAAKKLVTSHLRLVVKIAMEYRNAYYNLLDLVQEGTVGLMTAVKKFDEEKGTRLGSYAQWWIRSYILKYILDNFRLIKIGTTKNQRKLFYNLIQEKRKMESQGFIPETKLLSERLGVTTHEIEEMSRRLEQPENSLDAPVGGNHDSSKSAILEDFIADNDIPIDEKLAKAELQDIFQEKLKTFEQTLKAREVKILHERLLSEIPVTLQQIADEYGISKERARQIEERMIEKLRQFFKDSGVDVETVH